YIKAHANSRVVVISAKTDVEEKVRLLSSGADDYLTKPFDTKELAARIDVQLRNLQQMPRQGDILTWRDLTIDKQTRKVQVKNQVLNVTNTEYDILCLFMLTPEQPISKQKIYENIQGIYLGDDNTVNVHISNIRKKLAAFSDESYIKTVWGIGFMLE
nr:response regulator transcription factor [Staphylococcus lugdunensis]